jgi:hypothetical protein
VRAGAVHSFFFFLNGVSKKAKKDFVFVAQILQSDSVEKKQKKF